LPAEEESSGLDLALGQENMSSETLTVLGGPIFNGSELLDNHYLEFIDGRCSGAFALSGKSPAGKIVDLDGDIFSPGYADLQVNGGGGVLLNDHPSVQTLETMANAHRQLGTTAFLPTLITSKPETIKLAIDAAVEACRSEIPGIAGLHLEGPHLSIAKKGAHDASLIRPMHSDDLSLLVDAVAQLPLLKVTIAPESVSLEQVQQLTAAGVLVSLGHTNASYQTCVSYLEAGARCVTHLFNAMSQFGSREPGLTGAALANEGLHMGLIADGIHVHLATISVAINSVGGLHRIYLVTDAMAVAATSLRSLSSMVV